jgi:hypothetical protein
MSSHKNAARRATPLLAALILAVPASTNYQLNQFGFNSGSTVNNSSTNYSGNSSVGNVSGASATSTNYQINSGLVNAFQVNVPSAPVLTNPNNYYDKLKIVINTSGNPNDTKFIVAISIDNFVTTKYVKSDNTVGSTLVSADQRTYSGWGSASGITIIGLTPNTTYKVKVAALQFRLTESSYSAAASADTANPSITFSLSPSSVTFSGLSTATVSSANSNITAILSTNADSGGTIYINDGNNGLRSAFRSYIISSVTTDLSSVSQGYGAQIASTSGLTPVSPYNVSGTNVGILSTAYREILYSNVPVTNGTGQITLKAESATNTPAAPDYADTLTIVASANF